MKVDISKNTTILNWQKNIITISESEFTKADIDDIQMIVSMLCNIYCFEHTYDETQHNAILSHLGKSRKAKILFGVSMVNDIYHTKHFEICCNTGNTILPVLKYSDSEKALILYTRQ